MLKFASWLKENFFEDYNLEQKYAHYNHLLFGGSLPHVPIMWADLKRQAGVTYYVQGSRDHTNIRIEMSTRFKRNEQSLDSILIHEMIHTYLIVTTGDGDGKHGRRFAALASMCSHKSGITIHQTDDISQYELTNSHPELATVLLMTQGSKKLVNIYRGAPFDSTVAMGHLEAFWGTPGRMLHNQQLQVIKMTTDLGQKYGYVEGVVQRKWKEIGVAEIEKILQQGQVIRTITANSVSHEDALNSMPSKSALVVLTQNPNGSPRATFYNPSLARDTVKLHAITSKIDYTAQHWAGFKATVMLANSPVISQGLYKLALKPGAGYYTLTPDKVAALSKGAQILHQVG